MCNEYDCSQAKRAKEIPHLAGLQEAAKGKNRITSMLNKDVLMAFRAMFRARADAEGIGYRTLTNRALRETLSVRPVNEATLRKILREELAAAH